MSSVDRTTVVQPPVIPAMPEVDVFSPGQPVRPVTAPQPMSISHINTQDKNLPHNLNPVGNFQRTSRLNSSYIPVDQPGKL